MNLAISAPSIGALTVRPVRVLEHSDWPLNLQKFLRTTSSEIHCLSDCLARLLITHPKIHAGTRQALVTNVLAQLFDPDLPNQLHRNTVLQSVRMRQRLGDTRPHTIRLKLPVEVLA